MDPFSIIEQTWWLGIPIAFLGGIILGINPLALPITGTAVGLGAAGASGARGSGVKVVAAFGAGMVLVYTLVGLAAAQLDRVVESILRPYAGIGYLVLAALLIGLAAWLLLRPGAFCSSCAGPTIKNPTVLGAFLAGIPGGFVNCPACAAIVTGVAASAAELGSALYSGAVMFALGAGHAGVLVGASFFLTKGWALEGRRQVALQKVAALVLAGLASYLIYLGIKSGIEPGPRLP